VNSLSSLMYMAYFDFAVKYRKTMIGPVWVLMGPTLFILTLGLLFGEVSNAQAEVFIPHLAIGLIVWTLVSGFVSGSTTVFQRHRAQILQGGMTLIDIVVVDVLKIGLLFMHQVLIVVAVMIYFQIEWSVYSWVSLFGLLILVVNGVWLTLFFGMIGSRYRDLTEVVAAVMRIAFLATPIIWLPEERSSDGVVGLFLSFNPFFHFLDIVRAPLLGDTISAVSWTVVVALSLCGALITVAFYRRLRYRVPLWV